MNTHFESKHTMTGDSSDFAKSIVMLNRRISWRTLGIMYQPDMRHFGRIVEPLYLSQAKTVTKPAVKGNGRDAEL